jgi:glycine reductase
MAYRIIHYINQFFGGIGGEDKADHPPELREGPAGPGLALKQAWGDQVEIAATVVCGDNYCVGHPEEVAGFIGQALDKYQAQALVAGPAFNAGRYGLACGLAASAAAERGRVTLAAMFPENPGVDIYKANTFILPTSDSARGMGQAVPAMAAFALKLLSGRRLGSASEEGYIERGVRVNTFHDEIGAERAVSMLMKKVRGKYFVTEYKMPAFDRVRPRPGVKDLSRATIALVTSGGIVPKGNPDHIPASSARGYGAYSLEGVDDLTSENFQTAHGGYDQTFANEDPDRVLPVDVLRLMEKEGRIGRLYPTYFSTVGNGTAVAHAANWGGEIGLKLREAEVQAVILTST